MNPREMTAGLLLCFLGGMLTAVGIASDPWTIFAIIGPAVAVCGYWVYSEGVGS